MPEWNQFFTAEPVVIGSTIPFILIVDNSRHIFNCALISLWWLFVALSIRCPRISFLLHFPGVNLKEKSSSLILFNIGGSVSQIIWSRWMDVSVIIDPLRGSCTYSLAVVGSKPYLVRWSHHFWETNNLNPRPMNTIPQILSIAFLIREFFLKCSDAVEAI